MTLYLNGEEKKFKEDLLTITTLLEQIGVPIDYTAVEVNKEIVPKVQFEEFKLNQGDKVEVVRFVGGGKN